jgi:organic hydroperoxide reductase OsmC/OhrA
MTKEHNYLLNVQWTGNTGTGTSGYKEYDRGFIVSSEDKAPIIGSSDPAFLGDGSMYNPEEMLLASLSSCHMLWYLHLCADQKIIVTKYEDNPEGIMEETEDGGGKFSSVTLKPQVTITDAARLQDALALHGQAHKKCFIANSMNFPVGHLPEIFTTDESADHADQGEFSINKMLSHISLW